MYDNNPLNNFLSLIDEGSRLEEDNLRSAKCLERAGTVKSLLTGLEFDGATDWNRKASQENLRKGWVENVAAKPEFQSRRINELWDLPKSCEIEKDMSIRQVMAWANKLLKPSGLGIKADPARYSLKPRFDILGLIRRKNQRGRYYKDRGNVLQQEPADDGHTFDEQAGEMRRMCDLGKDLDFIDVAFEDSETDCPGSSSASSGSSGR